MVLKEKKLHIPVLAEELISLMRETPVPMDCFLDGTFGRGGHTRLVMENFEGVRVVALDRDREALDYGVQHFHEEIDGQRVSLIHSNFADIWKHRERALHFTGGHLFSGILLDLGVSSPQLDEAGRGFSFYRDGPLDMRMDREQEMSACHIVNKWSEVELVELFQSLGEVRRPQKVVRAIVEERKKNELETTWQLSHLIERVEGWRKRGHHPATRFFLALRLAVNKELEFVERGIPELIGALVEGGRLFVITFHSLEDRIVKNLFRGERERGILVNKKVIQAQWSEKKRNPRSRSAKLRVFQRGGGL